MFTDAIFGFHAQQAVEKGLKAWLSALEILFPLTHDISRLLSLLEQRGIQMMDLWDWVELTSFAVEHRYTWNDEVEAPLNRTELITRVHALLESIDQQIRLICP